MLSHVSKVALFFTIFFPQVNLWEEIKQVAKKDSYIQSMSRVAMNQTNNHYMWRNCLLRYKEWVIAPANPALHSKLLHEMHYTKVGGHSSILRTYKKLRQQFYWSEMLRLVQEYIKGCMVC
jgi:hypothetical protein